MAVLEADFHFSTVKAQNLSFKSRQESAMDGCPAGISRINGYTFFKTDLIARFVEKNNGHDTISRAICPHSFGLLVQTDFWDRRPAEATYTLPTGIDPGKKDRQDILRTTRAYKPDPRR